MAISKTPKKQSKLAEDIDLSIQETSRHLSRLMDSKLAEKNVDGEYLATPFGKQIIKFLPSLDFLISNSEYFTTHDSFGLPLPFILGLGLIADYETSNHVMESFKKTEELLKDAEEIIWISSDQVLFSTLPIIDEAVNSGVDFRIILPVSIIEEAESSEQYQHVVQDTFPMPHNRFSESVDVVIVMSEKEALLSFPSTDGSRDYHGFSFKNSEAIDWCRSLFEWYWDDAKQLRDL